MAEFEIIWSIDDAEWRRALEERQTRPPGTDFAKYAAASFILFGTLQMVYQDQALFPYSTLNQSLEQHNLTLRAQGLPEIAMPPDIVGVKDSWSISDLATQLHRIMSHEKFGSSLNQSATLIHTDGEIDIYLRQFENQTIISTDFFDGQILTVPTTEFVSGAMSFLNEISTAIHIRAHSILEWESMSSLKNYIGMD